MNVLLQLDMEDIADLLEEDLVTDDDLESLEIADTELYEDFDYGIYY